MTWVIVLLLHGLVSVMMNDCTCTSGLFHTTNYNFSTNRIGDSAKNAFHSNPENTVFDAKRLIGRKADDPEVKRDMKHW